MQQDPNAFQTMKPQFGEPEHLKCPRCDSTNTKFCYYNNYNLSQPRHFCKSCRRYWTKGGSLRNIPVGGGTRKNHSTKQRSSNSKKVPPSPSSSSSITSTTTTAAPVPLQMVPKPEQASLFAVDQDRRLLDIPGSFSSLLASNGQFGSLLDTMNSSTSSVPAVHFGDFPMVENSNLNTNEGMESIGDPALEMGDSSCWAGANGWPDLAIYTPGSSFQ